MPEVGNLKNFTIIDPNGNYAYDVMIYYGYISVTKYEDNNFVSQVTLPREFLMDIHNNWGAIDHHTYMVDGVLRYSVKVNSEHSTIIELTEEVGSTMDLPVFILMSILHNAYKYYTTLKTRGRKSSKVIAR